MFGGRAVAEASEGEPASGGRRHPCTDLAAAVACDFDELQRIARANPDGFTYSFGVSGSPAVHWRKLERTSGERPLARLVKILRLPVTRNEAGSYAWPSAYTEHPTDADWKALVRTGIYSCAQVRRMRRSTGMYLGYRTAITPDGHWQFFVAGDRADRPRMRVSYRGRNGKVRRSLGPRFSWPTRWLQLRRAAWINMLLTARGLEPA